MKKIMCCILLSICLCTFLAGCSIEEVVNADPNPVSTVSKERELRKIDNKSIYEFVDPDTGVHYLICSLFEESNKMSGITPRLNSDGTVMVTKVREENKDKGEN